MKKDCDKPLRPGAPRIFNRAANRKPASTNLVCTVVDTHMVALVGTYNGDVLKVKGKAVRPMRTPALCAWLEEQHLQEEETQAQAEQQQQDEEEQSSSNSGSSSGDGEYDRDSFSVVRHRDTGRDLPGYH